MARPFRAPWVPHLPIVSALSCFALMLSLPLDTWVRLAVWLLIGLTIYFAFGGRRALLGSAAVDR